MHYSITIHFHVIITNSTYFNRHNKFLLFLNGLTNKNTCKRIQSFTEFFFMDLSKSFTSSFIPSF
ncbi:hypothetical protein DZB82_06870 [Bacillus sp. dmp5]|nr:hypothetical protein [Bacillus cereus]MDR4438566.1 hypothetical protein [Bacillus cereus]RFB65028.1 hypothetical protein DZB82_06870 [Bacillus sp. dmp5]